MPGTDGNGRRVYRLGRAGDDGQWRDWAGRDGEMSGTVRSTRRALLAVRMAALAPEMVAPIADGWEVATKPATNPPQRSRLLVHLTPPPIPRLMALPSWSLATLPTERCIVRSAGPVLCSFTLSSGRGYLLPQASSRAGAWRLGVAGLRKWKKCGGMICLVPCC